MFDQIPTTIKFNVPGVEGSVHELTTLSTSRKRGKLAIELLPANIDLLVQSPPQSVEEEEFVPIIQQPDVKWCKRRSSVYCRYFCQQNFKWRFKHMRVERGPHFEERITRLAGVCQAFFEEHHHYSDEAAPVEDARVVPLANANV